MTSRLVRSIALFLVLAVTAAADTVTGTVVDANGIGVVGVTLDFDNATPLNPVTGAGGFFSVTVPAGTYEITFTPPNGSTLAPHLLADVVVSGVANLGNVTLQPGLTVQGTVNGASGAPIVGGDIDVFDESSGAKLFTPDGTTDALGQFSVRVPAGTYRIRFEPAPGQLLVAQALTGVVVSGNTTLGVVVLPTGVTLSGVVRRAQNLAPVRDVDIDVFDKATGVRIETPGDDTDATGNFSVIVPATALRVTFEALQQDRLVATEIDPVIVAGPTNLGNIDLAPGALVTGRVLGPGGVALAGVDMDFDMVAGDVRLLTPGDDTDANGDFAAVVPLVSIEVSANPAISLGLVASTIGPINVGGDVNVGSIQLAGGITVTGTVTGFSGPEQGCRVTVQTTATGQVVPTPGAFTDAAGNYAVVVPAGTYDFGFETRKASLSRDRVDTGIVIAGPTSVNAALSITPMLAYVEDPASPEPQTVPPGGSLFVTILWFNTNPVATGFANVDIQIIDPFGVATNLFPTFLLPLNPLQALFGLNVPLPLPPANPNHLGLHQRFRIVLTDPANGAEIDRDEFRFIRM